MSSKVPTLGLLEGVGSGSLEDGAREQRGATLHLYGGGHKAALFHLGALTRLNELGMLANLDTVGAVAGGSILAALLAVQVPWPLNDAFRDWPEAVAEPMRDIARRNARARALLLKPISPSSAEAGLEERYARELVESLGGAPPEQPRFVFGASGLSLGEIAPGERPEGKGELDWRIDGVASPGYDPALVGEVIVAVRDDLDAFGEAEQAVLENHGYLLADAAVRASGGRKLAGGIEPLPPEPPHPRWMDEARVRSALASSARRTRLGRLRPRRASRGNRAPQTTTPETVGLLERFRPFIQYDSLEGYRAGSVTTITNLVAGRRCTTLRRADGQLVAAAAPREKEARLDLDFLGGQIYANGARVQPGDFLEASGGSYAADARLAQAGHSDLVYGHARRDAEGRLWLQYWSFYYYNDKGFLDVGLHEGDWEMIQLRLGEDGRPDAVTYGQHAGGERAEWNDVERQQTNDAAVPVVYCARGSHASHFRPGTHEAPVVPDHNDGLGHRVRPRLVTIGDGGPGWVLWPGIWGSTRRREAFEADSPRGPREHPSWWDPKGFHTEARPAREVPHWTASAASTPPPSTPSLTATRDGDRVVVDYRFPAAATKQPATARIVAAPFNGEEPEVPRTRSVKVESMDGAFVLQLSPGEQVEGIRVSVATEHGVPGETIRVSLQEGERAG